MPIIRGNDNKIKKKTCIFVKYYIEGETSLYVSVYLMYRFLKILGILLLFHMNCIAQKDITIEWKNDTAWYVNPDFDPNYSIRYEPEITLPALGDEYDHYLINWGTGSERINDPTSEYVGTLVYPDEGIFDLVISLFKTGNNTDTPDEVIHKKIMNRRLEASFILKPENSRRCMEWGGDSVLLVLTERNNPKGTKYEVQVSSDVEKVMSDRDTLFQTEWIDADSAWIVMKNPTGIYEARVYVKMTWKMHGVTITDKTYKIQTFNAYHAPDVRDIFDFADTLRNGEELNFTICRSDERSQSYIQLDSLRLGKYQYHAANDLPYYHSVSDKQDMDIRYFWTDELPDAHTSWQEVTGMYEYVDTASVINFKKAGFYKLRIEAHNQCNYDPADPTVLLSVDSLWTDSVKNSSQKRYFQVFERAGDNIVCREDTICSNTDHIVLVDRNVRKSYDAPPTYNVTIEGLEKGRDYLRTESIFKGGINVDGNDGCDSTEIHLYILGKTGNFKIDLVRESDPCDPVEVSFRVHVGQRPELVSGTALKDFMSGQGAVLMDGDTVWQKCDSMRYTLQQDLWEDYSFDLDSVCFFLAKSSRKDTILNNRLNGSEVAYYDFDSTGNTLNYIRIQAHNYCGWSYEDSVKFYTRTKPVPILLRDSMAANDSLCVNGIYPYYWGGVLPEEYTVNFSFLGSGKVLVNGGYMGAGESRELMKNPDVNTFQYMVQGSKAEYYTISNAVMPTCFEEIDGMLYVIAPPDDVLYDTVHYCKSLSVLKTTDLFHPDRKSFRQASWKWNETTNSTDLFPEFALTRTTDDTLYYKLSNSKGCFLVDTVVVHPEELPQLELKDEGTTYCLPDTIRDFVNAPYLQQISTTDGFDYTVYRESVSPATLQCSSVSGVCNPLPLTDKPEDYTIIYVLENNRVDTAFAAGCRLEEPVALRLYSPKLTIQKADTVPYPWNPYDFSSLNGTIDTAKLNPQTLTWSIVRGTGSLMTVNGDDRLFGKKYTLSGDDQLSDTLLFELSGENICGDFLRDTLVLVVAHVDIKGYKDTICENSVYTLWPKIKSSFVDESSVTWQVCYPEAPNKQGTLAGSGTAATYKPATGADSVRIAIVGALEGYPAQIVKDTVVLLVNPSPVINLLQGDTLLAMKNEVNVRHIATSWLRTEHVTSVSKGSILAYNDGRWIGDTVYRFTPPVAGDPRKYSTSNIKFEGLPGCPAVEKKITFVNLPFAEFHFKHTELQICAGDRLRLDTLFEKISGFDQYTTLAWEAKGASVQGSFEPAGTPVHYVSAAPADGVEKLRLKTSKTYTAYDGTLCEEKLLTTYDMKLTVHQQPQLTLAAAHRHDTLCRKIGQLTVGRDWLDVSPARYRDSLRMNGEAFKADREYFTQAAPGQSDSLIFTVNQGGCTRWADQTDTLFIYRLPEMITGTFSVASLCEASHATVTIAGDLIHTKAHHSYWQSSGGTLNGDQPPVFTPVAGAERGSVTLHVQPPHGCPEDTLRQEFDIYRMPQPVLEKDTVCRLSGQRVTIPVTLVTAGNYSGLDKIDWFRKGESNPWGSTTGTASVEYTVTEQDSVAGFVDIVAQAWASGMCSGSFVYDTVRITLQDAPAALLPAGGIADLCQTASLNLGDYVGFQAAATINWALKTPETGSLNGSLYTPGEYFGNTVILAQLGGYHGCPDVVQEIPLHVIYTPEPQIDVLSVTTCQADTLRFKAFAAAAATWKWDFSDGSAPVFTGEVKHCYTQAGEWPVRLTAQYGKCERTTERVLTTYEKPRAIFHPQAQVALGKPVIFTSESLPEGVDCRWVFGDGQTTGSPSFYTFTGLPGERRVELWVTTEHGCMDSVSHTLLTVEAPVPDFDLHVDACSGAVEIINHSSRNNAEVEWNFGNGLPVSSDWDPLPLIYERTWRDTVYTVTLTLRNAAGSPSLSKEVKLVSKLKAGAEVMPATDGCNKLEKEIHILTQGVADSTRIWWGDGTYECWGRSQQVNLRKHRYQNDGTEVIYFPLRVAAENACHKDTTQAVAVAVFPVSVKAKLVIDNAYTNECYGEKRGFENKSFGFVPGGYTCEWQFESDRALVTDTSSKVSWLYERPGEYIVRLRVRDNCNEDTDSIRIVVHGNDSLDFQFAEGPWCSGEEIGMKFVEHGHAPFSNFVWTFPDGRIRKGSEVTYAFSGGEQWIELAAVADGCRSLVAHRLMVNETPQPLVRVDGDVTTGCQPFEVKFHGRNGKTQDAVMMWDFKDQAFSDQPDVEKTYTRPGHYPVVFRLTTPAGCTDSVVMPVTVLYTPDVSVDWSDRLFCTENGNFVVEGINTSADKADCAFEWWKGEERVSLQSDRARLMFEGVFGPTEVRLKAVHRESHCVAMTRDTLISAPMVKAVMQIDPLEVCEGAAVYLTDASAGNHTSVFEMGDGHRMENTTFNYVYEGNGHFPVKLKVSNTEGCRDSVEQIVAVHALPTADFSWEKDPGVNDLPQGIEVPAVDNGGVRFANHSSFTDEDGVAGELTYRWVFGDDSPGAFETAPVHVFPNNGIYEVWLYATTTAGCTDSISDLIDISAVKGLFFPTAFAPAVGDEGVSRFQPKGVGLHTYAIKIYDEWGTCVWSSDKLIEGKPAEYWDGTFKGRPLPKGVYNWQVRAVFIDGTVYEKDHGLGQVMLIR